MFQNKCGFTLVELLVAAVIIGVLAVFATQSFRQSGSDIRVQNAKAKAKVVALAANLFKEDHSGVSFSAANLENPGDPRGENNVYNDCSTNTAATLQTLVDCGYLEHHSYIDKDFVYNFEISANAVQVCITKAATGSRVIAETGDKYCTDGENEDYDGTSFQ